MEEIELKIYEAIKEYFYEVLEKNREKIEELTSDEIKRKCNDVLLDSVTYCTVEYAYKLRAALFNFMFEDFCNADKDIRTVQSFSKDRKLYYRGVTIPKKAYLKLLKTKVYTFHREGYYGSGQYLAAQKHTALQYAMEKPGNVLTVAIDRDAKDIYFKDVDKLVYHFLCSLSEMKDVDRKVLGFLFMERYSSEMLTIFASAYGYDTISNGDKDIVCAINPQKIAYLDRERGK